MFKSTLTLVACLWIGSASVASADSASKQTGSADDYHFKATLTDGNSSLRSVPLTWPVMSNLLQKDLQDLQVYNADQQAVPFTIRAMSANKQTQKQTRTLNFFPTGDIEKLGTILRQEADGQRYKTVKLIQAGQQYLIIDNPTIDGDKAPLPLQKLTLDWGELGHWMPKSLKVETSDDLTQWQSVAIEQLPYRLSENGVILKNHELRFKQSVKKRFIRLSGAEDFAPLLKALKQVSGDYQRVSVSRSLNWNNVDLKATENSRQFLYETPASLSIKQWRLEGLTTDSVYKGRLYTRSTERMGSKPDNWSFSQSFLQYSIQMNDDLVASQANTAPNRVSPQEWRIDLEQEIAADTIPKLALAWEPLELVFVAQGKAPFEIRYGSRNAQAKTRMQLDQLLKATTPEVVEIASVAQLSAVAEKDTGSSYKYLLWGLLAAAFLMLLYMARGLLKEMNSAD
ncbi:DUF3999 family protein [Leucothrix pacifica]|nr:DUF3999 family protein [Leucothrix pacifica]